MSSSNTHIGCGLPAKSRRYCLALLEHQLRGLALGDIRPRPHDFNRRPARVAEYPLLVAQPAVVPVLVAEAVFLGPLVLLAEVRPNVFEHALAVLRVDVRSPPLEAEGFLCRVAHEPLDVFADPRRRQLPVRLHPQRVDHRGVGADDVAQTFCVRALGLLGALALAYVAPARSRESRISRARSSRPETPPRTNRGA